MYCVKFLCFWKAFTKLSAPIEKVVRKFLIRFFIECIKYFAVLMVTFGFGYLIFYSGNAVNRYEGSLVRGMKTERLNFGLLQNGSFSKYPFIVEIPSKTSEESLKKQFIINRHSRPLQLTDTMDQKASKA